MMLSPDLSAAFIEVCKNGSTACTVHLRDHGWVQNGTRGYKRVPGTFPGRHTHLTDEALQWLDLHGTTTYGVVRNPWDRMASLWRASAPGTQSFWDYMNVGRFKHGHIDVLTFTQDRWLYGVDVVMRYEELPAAWNRHPHTLPPGEIKPVNVSRNRSNPDWTQREIDIVAERFRVDLARWGYTGPS